MDKKAENSLFAPRKINGLAEADGRYLVVATKCVTNQSSHFFGVSAHFLQPKFALRGSRAAGRLASCVFSLPRLARAFRANFGAGKAKAWGYRAIIENGRDDAAALLEILADFVDRQSAGYTRDSPLRGRQENLKPR